MTQLAAVVFFVGVLVILVRLHDAIRRAWVWWQRRGDRPQKGG